MNKVKKVLSCRDEMSLIKCEPNRKLVTSCVTSHKLRENISYNNNN